MNRQGYVKIIRALSNLLFVIMVEAGKVPVDSAKNFIGNFLKTLLGRSDDKN